MTKKELSGMKAGDRIFHKQLKECIIQKILYVGKNGEYTNSQHGNFFGLTLLPQTDEGKQLIHRVFGVPSGTPILEGVLSLVEPINRELTHE
jgi:hypothetical protein